MNSRNYRQNDWRTSRIIVRRNQLEIGCYGGPNAREEAMPFFRSFVNLINNTRLNTWYSEKCRIGDNQGNYIYIVNLNDYGLQAVKLLVVSLKEAGWKGGETLWSPIDINSYDDYYELMRIDMTRL